MYISPLLKFYSVAILPLLFYYSFTTISNSPVPTKTNSVTTAMKIAAFSLFSLGFFSISVRAAIPSCANAYDNCNYDGEGQVGAKVCECNSGELVGPFSAIRNLTNGLSDHIHSWNANQKI
jgi:hypothetical protein